MKHLKPTMRPWRNKLFRGLVVGSLSLLGSGPVYGAEPTLYFQAHRGGLEEVPENTLAAMKHAWAIPGAVPEIDIRTTLDGVLVCIHDKTPRRTTQAPEEWADNDIGEIPLATLQAWDAGSYFDPAYAAERVPTLDAVLDMLVTVETRQLYLDLKAVDNRQVIEKLKARKVTEQVIFVHGSPEACKVLSGSWPGARTMTWLSGPPEHIKRRFRALASGGFDGITQIQLHLQPAQKGVPGTYALGEEFLSEAVRTVARSDTTLQVRPFIFDTASLRALIDRGIHWYVADAPRALRSDLDAALTL